MVSTKNVMIDIETMGTSPGCAIVSIGAIKFDIHTGEISDRFYASVDLQNCLDVGLTIDSKTLLWWMAQSAQAREKVCEGKNTLEHALTLLGKFIDSDSHVWGNSASFDCGILTAAYKKLNMQLPWYFWNEKCFRTINNLFPGNHPKKDAAKAHDPIYDCEYQIQILCSIWKKLSKKIYV